MKLLFVAFSGHRSGLYSVGWTVVECSPIRTATDVEALTREVERLRGYDKDSLVISNFRRLED